jgi:arginine decarboxylase
MNGIKITTSAPMYGLGENISADGIIIGMRVPKDYFITQGTGESDITVHAGSYHLALKQAGIEMANIMTYSSILPGIAREVPRPKKITHGAVMETITSVCDGRMGERLSAGIIFSWLYDRNTHERYGGLVCEHQGKYDVETLKENLELSLNELYINGFEEEFYLQEPTILTESFVPKKQYGTALVAICFTNHVIPILGYK